MADSCAARFHSNTPSLGDLSCRLDAGHGDNHEATGLYDYQTIYWLDGHRRQFTGDFHSCDESSCCLPAGHHGRHAT